MPRLEKPTIPTPSTYSRMPTTMAGKKPLHELLSHEQEPFLLHDYILHHRRQLNHPLSKPKLRDFHFPVHYDFCIKRMRAFGAHHPKKLPLFEFPSAGELPRSPCLKCAVSLNVPARTAALLLEAASRIQRSSSARLPKKRSLGNGFLGFILKRLARRKSKTARFGRNGNDIELSHVETAYGGGGHGLDNDVEGNEAVCDENSCESSLLFETPDCISLDDRWPEFSSPAVFPKHFGEGNEEEANGRLKGMKVNEEQEEREQFSPVSVLDPPFEVDEEDPDSQVVDHEEEDGDVGDVGFNYDCSYAFVQRTKEQLLDKLQSFERLARLDPVELEKRMLDSDDKQSVSFEDTTAMEHEDRVTICFHGPRKSPNGISKLIADLVAEEEGEFDEDRLSVIGRVNKRLESWVESCTVDVIVGEELRAQWNPDEEQFRMLVKEIEVCMLESLLEEFTMEETTSC